MVELDFIAFWLDTLKRSMERTLTLQLKCEQLEEVYQNVVVDREANDLKEEVAQAVRQQRKAYGYITQTMVKNVLKKIEFTLG